MTDLSGRPPEVSVTRPLSGEPLLVNVMESSGDMVVEEWVPRFLIGEPPAGSDAFGRAGVRIYEILNSIQDPGEDDLPGFSYGYLITSTISEGTLSSPHRTRRQVFFPLLRLRQLAPPDRMGQVPLDFFVSEVVLRVIRAGGTARDGQLHSTTTFDGFVRVRPRIHLIGESDPGSDPVTGIIWASELGGALPTLSEVLSSVGGYNPDAPVSLSPDYEPTGDPLVIRQEETTLPDGRVGLTQWIAISIKTVQFEPCDNSSNSPESITSLPVHTFDTFRAAREVDFGTYLPRPPERLPVRHRAFYSRTLPRQASRLLVNSQRSSLVWGGNLDIGFGQGIVTMAGGARRPSLPLEPRNSAIVVGVDGGPVSISQAAGSASVPPRPPRAFGPIVRSPVASGRIAASEFFPDVRIGRPRRLSIPGPGDIGRFYFGSQQGGR